MQLQTGCKFFNLNLAYPFTNFFPFWVEHCKVRKILCRLRACFKKKGKGFGNTQLLHKESLKAGSC